MCPRRSALEAEGQAIDLTCSSVCIRLGVVLGRFWVPLKKDYRVFFGERHATVRMLMSRPVLRV